MHRVDGRAPVLLARHRDADSILRRDEVVRVLGGVGNGELDALDPAVESVAARAVIRGDGRAAVLADIAAVVGGEDHRLSHRNSPFADLLAVDKERHLAALAEAAAGVGEFHADLVLANGERARGFNIVVVHSGDVVAVLELAAFRIQAPAANVRALCNDHALGARRLALRSRP